MVQLTKIYTRGGDQGETSLGDGSRVAKHDARVEAYGTVDEANAVIGLVRVEIARAGADEKDLDAALSRIQNDLFDLGADLCTPEDGRRGKARFGSPRARSNGLKPKSTRSTNVWHRLAALSCQAARRLPPNCIWRERSPGAPSAA